MLKSSDSKVRFRRIGGALAVSAMLLALAACGGSEPADSSPSSSISDDSGSGTQSQNQEQNRTGTNQAQNQEQAQEQGREQTGTTQASIQNQEQQPAFPVIAIVSCSIGNGQGLLTVTASSTATGGNKGVTSVHVLTYNNEGASLRTDLTWLGPETGFGDQWTTGRVAYGTGFQTKMTVVARSSSGATKSADFSGRTSPCPN